MHPDLFEEEHSDQQDQVHAHGRQLPGASEDTTIGVHRPTTSTTATIPFPAEHARWRQEWPPRRGTPRLPFFVVFISHLDAIDEFSDLMILMIMMS